MFSVSFGKKKTKAPSKNYEWDFIFYLLPKSRAKKRKNEKKKLKSKHKILKLPMMSKRLEFILFMGWEQTKRKFEENNEKEFWHCIVI